MTIHKENLDHVDVARKVASGGYKWTEEAPAVLPAFVAEHDLGPFPGIQSRLRDIVDLGGTGYHDRFGTMSEAFCGWSSRRHAWTPDPELVVATASVLQGVWASVEAFTSPDEAVVLTPPIYFPFNDIGQTTGRRQVDWPLVRNEDGWHYDLDHLEHLLGSYPEIRLLILCHPHNPTGRVLTAAQLFRIVEICSLHDVVIVSDEIHSDFVYPGATHRPMATIPGASERTVTLTSGIKTFAIGGLKAAVASFADEDLHRRFLRVPPQLLGTVNRLGCEAAIVAWEEADLWTDTLVSLFDGHRRLLVNRIRTELPEIQVHLPDSTFLAWLDLSALEPGDRPATWLRERTGVRTKSGPLFGQGGEGHVRFTFGTSSELLKEMLDRLAEGLGG